MKRAEFIRGTLVAGGLILVGEYVKEVLENDPDWIQVPDRPNFNGVEFTKIPSDPKCNPRK